MKLAKVCWWIGFVFVLIGLWINDYNRFDGLMAGMIALCFCLVAVTLEIVCGTKDKPGMKR